MSGLSDRIRSAGEQLSSVGPGMIPGWLMTAGIGGWLIVGVAAVLALTGWFFGASASISIPLLLAMVIGMVAYPLVEKMTARGVPKALAAAVVLVLLGAIVAGVIWLTITGVIAQWPAIEEQLARGVAAMNGQLEAIGIDPDALRASIDAAQGATSAEQVATNPLLTGLLSSVGSALSAGLSGIFSLLFGVFISATLLYYVLTDFPTIAQWLSRHMGGIPIDVGSGIVDDAVGAMRGYFRGTTITGVVVAICIGGAMLIMGVPLAPTVALVTFLTCYIPFFGAIISGAFAFVVALGSNGLPTAVALLVVVLLTQNILQTVINARVMGESLNLHPLVVLVVTMLGGIFGGLLGAALGAPLAALFVSAGKRLTAAFGPEGPRVGAEEPA